MKRPYHKLLITLLVAAFVAAPAFAAPYNDHVAQLYTFVKNHPKWVDYLSSDAESEIVDAGCEATGRTSTEMYQEAIKYAERHYDSKAAATMKKRIRGKRIGMYFGVAVGAVALLLIAKFAGAGPRQPVNDTMDPASDIDPVSDLPRPDVKNEPAPAPKQPARMVGCAICFEEKSMNDCAELSCKHTYCRECLGEMVDHAIHEKTTAQLKCPAPKCQKMTQRDIAAITRNNRGKIGALSEIATREWILQQPNAKQCPTPNCTYAFINEGGNRRATQCPSCKNRYCSSCLINHPTNKSCAQAKAERTVDKNSAAWINQHTKPCPQCKTRIEKNEGCLWIACTHCHHGFCWHCKKDDHHVYVCDRPAA